MKKKQSSVNPIVIFLIPFIAAISFTLFNKILRKAPAVPTTTPPSFDTISAESTLVYFFDYLKRKDYVSASNLFYLPSQEKENFARMIPAASSEDFVNLSTDKLLEEYCQTMPTCLPVDILETTEISPTETKFTVQHFRANRSIFQVPGYMGSAPRDTFEYTVKKIDGLFKVTTPPAYIE